MQLMPNVLLYSASQRVSKNMFTITKELDVGFSDQ